LVQVGRFEEAIAEGKQAVALDPLSLALNLSLGLVFYFARRYDQTIEQQRKALELEPNFAPAHTLLSLAYLQKSMIQEAIAESQKVPPPRVTLGYAYAVGGNRPEAQKVLDQLSALSNKRYVSAAWFVLIYLGLGEKEKAFEWLERAYNDRSIIFLAIKVAQDLDPLRSDPRFADLLRRMGLRQVPLREPS
jgi:tetratricopeptide (TPR) repeat protein